MPVKTLMSASPAGLEKFFEEVGYPVTDKKSFCNRTFKSSTTLVLVRYENY